MSKNVRLVMNFNENAKLYEFVMNNYELIDWTAVFTDNICVNHGGKMEMMQSISTSCLNNELCKKYRRIKGSICQHCFAAAQLTNRKNNNEKYSNDYILKNFVVPYEYVPKLNAAFFRIEAFGDIETEIQAINYLNLIRKNKYTFFGWWTKNPWLIDSALKTMGIKKPKNCNIIYSDLMINGSNNIESMVKKYNFINGSFIVYDKKTIKEKNIKINCGGQHCIDCLRCYTKHRTFIEVCEKLK